MKFRDVKGYGAEHPCKVIEQEVPTRDSEDFILIQLKSMLDILDEYECYFDSYGNLCSRHGHLAPSYFGHLGQRFHAHKGCGWNSDESKWLILEKKAI